MRIGFVLISNAQTEQRAAIVRRSLNSLLHTHSDIVHEPPALQVIENSKTLVPMYEYADNFRHSGWQFFYRFDPPGPVNVNTLVTYGAETLINPQKIFDGMTDLKLTHIGFLWDDFYYHPDWLTALVELIGRKPDASAWSIYRSSYTRHHRVLWTDEYGDTKMTMHDGLGVMTVEEWKAYDAKNRSDFTVPNDHELHGGCTIDIHHAYERPGARWATGTDFAQNLGVHEYLGRQDQAINFVGFEDGQ